MQMMNKLQRINRVIRAYNAFILAFNEYVSESLPTMDEWDEKDHPRDKEGKFTNSCINITGDELGKYSSTSELRARAKQYYKENLQGTTVEHPELGEVGFTNKGLKETIHFSSNEDKLKLIPHLKDIIKTGKVGKEEKPKHPRNDRIVSFRPITNTVIMNDEKKNVEVLVYKDDKGHFYYDMFIDVERKNPLQADRSKIRGLQGTSLIKDSMTHNDYEINIFFGE